MKKMITNNHRYQALQDFIYCIDNNSSIAVIKEFMMYVDEWKTSELNNGELSTDDDDIASMVSWAIGGYEV